MKKLAQFGFLLGLVSFLPQPSLASESVQSLLPHYIAIQKALASDDLGKAVSEAKALDSKIKDSKDGGLKTTLASTKAVSESKSLSDARKHFKKLSDPFVEWVKKNKSSEYEVAYCPMAGASWVQEKGEILNPYFGAQMLSCGEKTS